MENLEQLKQERTKYIKAYRNCTPYKNQTLQESAEMRKGFGRKHQELDKQIKKIQRNIRSNHGNK